MAFLPAIIKIIDALGVRVDRPRADGTYQPIVLGLDSTITATSELLPDETTLVRLSANGTTYGNDPTKLALDGSNSPSADISMDVHRLTDLDSAVDPRDAVPLDQVQQIIGAMSIDDLLAAFSISSFTLSGTNYASVVEVGTTLSSLAAASTYISGPPIATTTIADTDSGTWSFTTPFASGTRSGTVQKTTNNAYLTVTLTATKPHGSGTVVATSTVYWRPKVYHGPHAIGTYNAAFITGLAASSLQASVACTFTDTMGASEYDYYAAPSSYGTPTFQYGALEGGWVLVAAAVSVTSNGVAQNYDLWQTQNLNLGETEWTVS